MCVNSSFTPARNLNSQLRLFSEDILISDVFDISIKFKYQYDFQLEGLYTNLKQLQIARLISKIILSANHIILYVKLTGK